ncbi:hypothetical protein GCM10025864_13000 [Luteimicrobium album]|uniref:Uncharacterized protein n=1 Tax=Luteimicrobium album TaxID=1054550 RepID=A0ABQ6HYK1_9MICO|nr:hypothetical protein [Luteimicrobium album]GMA23541.1 hypothetical protein GCM10025864_13000 [Luteimicrobium album]
MRGCEEPALDPSGWPLPEPTAEVGAWQDWPWSLMAYVPAAARAIAARSQLVVWHPRQPEA